MTIRLNLGSGSQPLPGYFNIDIHHGQPAFPLSYADNSVDEIRASHILEHFDRQEVALALRDWTRALKPGGTLKIAVPDFNRLVVAYLADDGLPVELYVMGGQVDQYDLHKTMWDRRKLSYILTCLGYTDIVEWQSEIGDCASLDISLNLKGTKSGQLQADHGDSVVSPAGIHGLHGQQPGGISGEQRTA